MKVVNQASAQVEIRKLIENHLQKKGEVRAAEIIRKTGLSRTYVNRILQQLQREGRVRPIGKANRARYVVLQSVKQALASELSFHRILKNQHLEEDIILDQIKAETGIGVFKNIMITRKLASEQEAIQDLLKGKQTTVPDRHTGEGIFFTSKAADSLEIKSSNKKLLFDNHVGDAFVRDVKARKGTQIDFWIALDSPRELEAVFRGYTSEELAFDRTTVAVKLYKMDSGFVSRSQARRVLAGLEKFKTIALDFANVTLVGQGFIDEVFRVWRSHHPEKVIEVRNADQNVQFMIDRHLATQQKS